MKRMVRALALLLALVMLFTTCGFAEEPEAVDIAPEAIETAEQPAEPAEEAIEAPVEEEPVELVPDISIETEDFGYVAQSCPAVASRRSRCRSGRRSSRPWARRGIRRRS